MRRSRIYRELRQAESDARCVRQIRQEAARASTFVRIPLAFYRDHVDRDLPAPPLIWGLPEIRGAVIDRTDPNFAELVDDARHYASPHGPDAAPPGLRRAAKALLRALANASPLTRETET